MILARLKSNLHLIIEYTSTQSTQSQQHFCAGYSSIFDIFSLRLRCVPLGMPDYLLALELVYPVDALNHPEQIETIKSVCRLFWAKSYEDLQLFDETFDIEMNKRLAQLRKKQAAEEAQRISVSETPSSFPPLPNRPGPQNPSMNVRGVSLTLQIEHLKLL
jgi:hypothetical protein